MPEDDLTLDERVERLETQVAALRAGRATQPAAAPDDGGDFWAVEGLAARTGRPQSNGAVMIVGDVALPGGDEASWQYGLTTDELVERDWEQLAPVVAALGHPVRLAILRCLLDGVRSVREIAVAVDVGSTGQVYHHLRALQAAGWVHTRSGGEHAVPAERLVPLLAVLLGAIR